MKKVLLSLLVVAMILGILSGCSSNTNVSETDWPNRTVRIIVPYNAGGDTDLYAREVAKYLEKHLGQTFVIVNQAGSSGITAASEVMDAKPDGYITLFTHTAKLTQEAVGLADFSFTEDFASGGNIVKDSTFVLVASAGGPYKSLQDVVDASKENPFSVRYSSVYGSIAHLVAAQWETVADIKLKMLDVGSSNGDKIAALLSDQIDLIVVNYSTVADYVENGDFIILGLTGEKRNPGIPDIPTFVEQGYKVIADKRYSFNFPKETDKAIIAMLNEALEKVAEDPDFKKAVEHYYGEVHYTNPSDTYAYESSTVSEYRELMKQYLIK